MVGIDTNQESKKCDKSTPVGPGRIYSGVAADYRVGNSDRMATTYHADQFGLVAHRSSDVAPDGLEYQYIGSGRTVVHFHLGLDLAHLCYVCRISIARSST